MTTIILPTRNEDWGFCGTITRAGNEHDAGEAWLLAFQAIARETGAGPEGVRDFLDSRHGRHFADDVANEWRRGHGLNDAIMAAAARWMDWKIGRRLSRETGIPAGLPYLRGFVTHFDILADADA